MNINHLSIKRQVQQTRTRSQAIAVMQIGLIAVSLLNTSLAIAQENADWMTVGGDRGNMRYSTLSQINQENVAQLDLAWEYKTGELSNGRGKIIECTPIIIDGVMYVTTAYLKLVALDAATGSKLWEFDPLEHSVQSYPLASGGVNRGVAYWSDGQPNGEQRILHGISAGLLYSLDAKTGQLDPEFGEQGVKDLREDFQEDLSKLGYGPTSAPTICGDVVVLGVSCGEGPGVSAPGDIRGFDVRTGKQLWRFHTVPRPGEFGNETWEGDSWKDRGAANAWGGASSDPQRGLIFCATGSAAFDFYGGDRKGENLFANCVIAIDAKSGKRKWHFQTLRHDLWDHDLPVYPNLVTVIREGKSVDAVAQVTKTGYVYLLNRDTGKSLFEIQQEPVPESDVDGEQAWPTQPIPVKPAPFAAQHFDESNVTTIGEKNRDFVIEKLKTLRNGPAFNPPSLQGTVVIPGFHGGANWSGASFDPETAILYLNSTNLPNIMTLVPAPAGSPFRFVHKGYIQFRDQEGYPAIAPPWGLLNAINLNTGEYLWRTVLGEYPELTERGIPQTGTESFGGTIVTAGGLVFIGGTTDEKFRAFDKSTGKMLWDYQLPAGGYANPSTYMIDGKQYVVIAAGGAGKLRTKAGESFMVFALP
ncbi:pyrroloquinoline quinone-dependent dehydrogenase [Rubinisphaera italica]|uniref:Quinoprotein glucose dehydrogenase n=1 Tax=Rubinisphaera italica TaxID=2527969 RepID=A0A5C5XCS5_9PLAN|nr:pyrroloquinoline quinone-dependent dehydrogenase [Rubinisphaera italica]TWT60564.1 Quinoprotein glucose dehydrogenase [Rubinisphaera italica]